MKKNFLTLTLILSNSLVLLAQQELTLHYMQSVPQRSFSNPALIPDSRIYFGIPGLSSIGLGLSSPISISDMFIIRSDDSLLIDLPTIQERLGKGGPFALEFSEELFAVGFTKGNNHFSFSSSLKATFHMALPSDLPKFLIEGNAAFLGQDAEIGGINLNYKQYWENSLGYSRQFTDALRVGVRAKLLSGVASVSTKDMSFTFYTDPDDYALTATSNIHIMTSLPFLADSIVIGSLDSAFEFPEMEPKDLWQAFRSERNSGFAIDIGANYKLSEKWSFNASLIDLGSVNWTKNVRTFNSDEASFTFDGIDIYEMFSDSVNQDEYFQDLLDSASSIFDFYITDGSFRDAMIPKLYAGASYSLTPGTVFGGLCKVEYFNKELYPSLTLSVNKRFTRVLTLAGSYTIRKNSFANVGLGVALNVSAFQLYIASDYVNRMIYLDRMRLAGIRFGMNLTIGREVKQEKPVLDT